MAHQPGHVEDTGLPPELLAMFPGLDQVLAGAGGGAVDQSPPVFMGSRSRTSGTLTSWGARNKGWPKIKTADDIRTEDEAINDFYGWDANTLLDFQERAFSAGLYGTSDRSRIRFGDPTDGDTFTLWKQRVGLAAGFYNAGRKITPWDTLDLAGAGNLGLGDEGGGGRAASNPLDLQALARQEGTAGLGRGLTGDELARVTGALQGTEAPFLGAGGAVAPPGGAGMQEVARQQVRGLDPVRFDSRSAVKVASVIQQMMEGNMPAHQLPAEGG